MFGVIRQSLCVDLNGGNWEPSYKKDMIAFASLTVSYQCLRG